MTKSGFDGTLLLNESFRFIDFHPIDDDEGIKHIVVPVKDILRLYSVGEDYFIDILRHEVVDDTGGHRYSIAPSEYKKICQRLGVSDVKS